MGVGASSLGDLILVTFSDFGSSASELFFLISRDQYSNLGYNIGFSVLEFFQCILVLCRIY
jgi:hypothetical protein